MSGYKILRVFLSLFLTFGLIAIFSTDSRRAAMQSKSVSPNQSLVPDLGVGASLNGARPFQANNAWFRGVRCIRIRRI
jgi:hypothetical protein